MGGDWPVGEGAGDPGYRRGALALWRSGRSTACCFAVSRDAGTPQDT